MSLLESKLVSAIQWQQRLTFGVWFVPNCTMGTMRLVYKLTWSMYHLTYNTHSYTASLQHRPCPLPLPRDRYTVHYHRHTVRTTSDRSRFISHAVLYRYATYLTTVMVTGLLQTAWIWYLFRSLSHYWLRHAWVTSCILPHAYISLRRRHERRGKPGSDLFCFRYANSWQDWNACIVV